jgi:hypothetical protein
MSNTPVPESAKFEVVRESEPTELAVTQADGKKWNVRVVAKVIGVDDMQQVNPLSGQPLFGIKTTIFVDVKPAEGGE